MNASDPCLILVLSLCGLNFAVWLWKSASPAVREKLRALGRLPLPEASLIVFLLLSAVYVGGTKPNSATNSENQSVSAEPAVPAASGEMSFAVADAEGGGATLYTLLALAEGGGVVTQRLTAAQYAAGFALANVLTNSGWLSVPANAVVHAPWTRYGVAEDTFYAPASNWSFVLGSNFVAGAHVSSSGTLSFGWPKGSPRAAELPDATGLNFLAPLQASFGTVPPGGRFWNAASPSNAVFTWENVYAGRDTNSPVTFQTELLPNGDFVYRYAFTNALSLTNFAVGAQNNGGGETYALSETNLLANGLELRWRAFGILDPELDDHDGDGLSTYDEVMINGTDPRMPDTDLDGLSDSAELNAGTNPLVRDTDGDGIPDGGDPNPLSPDTADANANGLPDAWEAHWFGTNAVTAAGDANGDGMSNLANLLTGTDPAAVPPPGFAVTNAALAAGLDAWEIAPALALDPPSGMTNVLARTIPAARTSPWQQFFVSSSPGAASDWFGDGLALSWSAGTNSGGATASPSGDSLRLEAGTNLFESVSVRLDPTRAGGLLRLPRPLYLIRWTPQPALTGGTVTAVSSNGVPCAAAALESAGAEAAPFALDASARPHRAAPGADELAERAAPPDPASAVRAVFAAGGASGYFTADTAAQGALPAFGTNAPVQILLITPAVILTDGAEATRPFGNLSPPYPLDTADLRSKCLAGAGTAGFTVEPGIESELLAVTIDGEPGNSRAWEGGSSSALAAISLCGSNVWNACVEREPYVYRPDTEDDSQCDCTKGCGCSETCDCTEGSELGSIKFRIPFGTPGRGQLSGFLWLALERPAAVTPDLFRVLGGGVSVSTNAGTVAFACEDNNGATLAMENISGGVRISVFDAEQTRDHGWEITNPAADTNRVRIVRRDSAENTVSDETYSYGARSADNGLWARTNALDGSVETLDASGDIEAGGFWMGTRTRRSASGDLLSQTFTVRNAIGSGAAAVSRVTQSEVRDAASGVRLQTYSYYWEDGRFPARNGLLRYRRGNAAPWEYHACDSRGREVLRAVQANASATPEPSSVAGDLRTPGAFLAAVPGSDCDVTVSSYDPAEGSGDTADFNDSREPRETTAYALRSGTASAVSREWKVFVRGATNGIGTVSVRTVRAASSAAAFNDAANASSLSVAYAGVEDGSVPPALRGLPLREETESGGVRAWAYELTDYDGVNGTLTVTERSGTTASPDGVPGLSTYTVETRDAAYGLVLRRETRLCDGSGEGPLLSWEQSGYDAKRRLLGTSYSDGTFASNSWSCCRLEASVGRDGSRTEYDAVPGNARWSRASQASLGSLPGAGGRFPAVETFTDSLGRETNSVRAVMFNGSRDAAYAPLATVTEYPFGTDGCRVTTDPLGVATVTRTYYADNAKVTETASGGVTNRATEAFGGATVEERFWDGKWTRETRSTSYGADGCRVETVLAESSDYPAVTKSVTAYDFLGRAVSVATPLGVTSNFYDGAADKLVRVSRTGQPGTLYAYDGLGNVSATATDADGDGQITAAGSDRINSTVTRYENDTNGWWRVTASAVWNRTGVDAALTSSVTRVRMTGLGGAAPSWTSANAILTAQSMTVDGHGNATLNSTYTDAGAASVWQVAESPFSTQAVIRVSMAGSPVTDISASCVTNTSAYDGFARQTAATDGRGNTSRTVYNALGQVEYTEDAASNRTSYAYDALGRCVEVTDALTNTTHTAYDGMGNVIRTWGAAYPVEYGYDSQGRRISMKTFRDENGAGDETRWLYDSVTGLLTNKVYADGKGTAYGYTTSGRLSSRTWARGAATSYAYDTLGQLVYVDYSGSTPDVAFAYDRLGRMVSAVSSASTNLFEYSGFDLVTETQNGVTLTRPYDGLGRSAGIGVGAAYAVDYGYDSYGRFASITLDVNSASSGTQYAYASGADIVALMTNTTGFAWQRVYEQNRDLIARMENRFAPDPVSAFDYSNDAAGKRTRRIDSTPALSVTNWFGYNSRSEVTSAVMYTNEYGYVYDPVGNRLFSTANVGTNTYTANTLNQYTAVTNAGLSVFVTYDADGNMTRNGALYYQWDGENNMRAAYPCDATNGSLRVDNRYDFMKRRVVKQVKSLTGYEPPSGFPPMGGSYGEWVPMRTTRFVWDGMNIAAEITVDENAGTTNVTRYVWGLDLSGSIQGAGGVGGLVAVIRDGGSVHFPCYDVNGNITEYVDATGTVVAHREFDPFGNTTVATGALVHELHFWFSTKYLDEETGNLVYQQRQYIPPLSRWANRDPIEEAGGVNLYGFVSNNPINKWDLLGLKTITVPKCHGRLILGHTSKRDPIHWEFPGGCAYGGVVGCWPEQNNPTNQANRWPNVPMHNERMFEGLLKRLFGATSLTHVDFSTDYYGGEEQETDFTKAVENVLSQTSFNNIVDKLCGSSCCCDEIVLTIEVTKGGWEIEDGVKPYSLKPGMTVTVKGRCPSRKK